MVAEVALRIARGFTGRFMIRTIRNSPNIRGRRRIYNGSSLFSRNKIGDSADSRTCPAKNQTDTQHRDSQETHCYGKGVNKEEEMD